MPETCQQRQNGFLSIGGEGVSTSACAQGLNPSSLLAGHFWGLRRPNTELGSTNQSWPSAKRASYCISAV